MRSSELFLQLISFTILALLDHYAVLFTVSQKNGDPIL